MSKSKSKAWAQRAKSQSMQDRANGLIDGDRYVAPKFDLPEIAQIFDASRLGALALGELHGEAVLPGDEIRILDAVLVGIVERDLPVAEYIDMQTPFQVSRADFASGDWVFVMVDRTGDNIRKVAFK